MKVSDYKSMEIHVLFLFRVDNVIFFLFALIKYKLWAVPLQ